MNPRKILLICMLLFFSAKSSSYAAFPINATFHDSAAIVMTAPLQAQATTEHVAFSKSPLIQKARHFLLPYRERWGSQQRSKKCGLSILSASMAILAYALLLTPVFILTLSASVILLCYGLALALGLGAFITGIIALAKRQRLRMLAILGIAIGSEFVAGLLVVLILLSIW